MVIKNYLTVLDWISRWYKNIHRLCSVSKWQSQTAVPLSVRPNDWLRLVCPALTSHFDADSQSTHHAHLQTTQQQLLIHIKCGLTNSDANIHRTRSSHKSVCCCHLIISSWKRLCSWKLIPNCELCRLFGLLITLCTQLSNNCKCQKSSMWTRQNKHPTFLAVNVTTFYKL